MTERRLTDVLRVVGAAAARRGTDHALRATLVLIATVAVALSLVSLVAVVASYDGRAERGLARTPIAASAGEQPIALYYQHGDSVDFRPVSVVYVVPQQADAEPPPGLSRWPAAGEVYLSPQLLREGAGEGIKDRYGEYAGAVAPSGLVDPTERLAYVHPLAAAIASDAFTPIAAFGAPAGPPSGAALNDRPASHLVVVICVFLLLPAVLLLVLSARLGSAARDRRLRLLQVLGATPQQLRRVVVAESSRQVWIAHAVVAVLAAVMCLVDVTLPGVGFTVVAADVRASAPLLAVALAAAYVLTTAVVVGTSRVRSRRQDNVRRLDVKRIAVHPGRITLFAVACYLAAHVDSLLPRDTLILGYAAGIVVLLATLPSVMAAMLVGVGRVVVAVGSTLGSAGSIVAGRKLMFTPESTSRVISSVAVGLIVLVSVQVWLSKLAEPAVAARDALATVGTTLVNVSPPQGDVDLQPFVDELSSEASVLSLRMVGDSKVQLQGSCEDLGMLQLSCAESPQQLEANTDPRLSVLSAQGGPGMTYLASTATVDQEGSGQLVSLVVLSRDGQDLSIEELKVAMATRYAPTGHIDPVGGLTLEGATILVDQGRWIELFGATGLLLVSVGLLLACVCLFIGMARDMAPLSILAGRSNLYWHAASWQVAAPFTLSIMIGAVVAYWVTAPLTTRRAGGTFPSELVQLCVGGVIASGVLLAAVGAAYAARAARTWAPGRGSAG